MHANKGQLTNFRFKSLTSTDGSATITQTATTVDVSSMGGVPSDPLNTTDGNATVLQFNGGYPTPGTDKTWFFEIKALGVATTGEKQAFKIEGVVTNVGGSLSLVGTNTKIDLQRSTSDLAVAVWDPMTAYNQNDFVEYELNTYTANTSVNAGQLSPDQNASWTLAYSGWNVNAEIIGNTFRVRAKGSAGKNVTWSAAISFIEA